VNDDGTQVGDMELLALHGLAVKKAGPAAAVAGILGADEGQVASALDAAAAAGRAMAAKGMYMVTPAGRSWLDEQYPVVFADLRADSEANAALDRFERVNRDLLRLLTDWQMMPAGNERVPNDHSDPDYDRDIIDRLGAIHDRALKPLERLQASDGRLGEYIRRLEEAYDKALAGENDYVSGARVDSYHTVWHELHEDLLRMFGREREEQT